MSRNGLVEVLEKLWSEMQSGTVFCVTEKGKSATVTLQKGEIVGLGYGTLIGQAALCELISINLCTLAFKPNVILHIDDGLPDSVDILLALEEDIDDKPTAAKPSSVDQLPWSAWNRLRYAVEHELGVLIGTKARLRSRQYFADQPTPTNANDVLKLIYKLSYKKASSEQREVLIRKISQHAGYDLLVDKRDTNEPEPELPGVTLQAASEPHLPSSCNQNPAPANALPPVIDMMALKKVAVVELHALIGPIGELLCEKHFDRVGQMTDPDAVRRLLGEIMDEAGHSHQKGRSIYRILLKSGLVDSDTPN